MVLGVDDLLEVEAGAGLLRVREVLGAERDALLVAGHSAALRAVVNAGRDIHHDGLTPPIREGSSLVIELGDAVHDHVLAREGRPSERPIESLLGVGDAEPVGIPLGLVAAEDIELRPVRLGPTAAVLGIEEADDLDPLLEAMRDRSGDCLSDLAGPLGDEMIGAEDNAAELAAVAALVARPLGVLEHADHPQEGFPGPHLADQEAAAHGIQHLDRRGDHVFLGLERFAEQVVELGERITTGDVERVEGGDRLLAEDLAVVLQVAVEARDLRERLDLGGPGREVEEDSILDGLVHGVGADGLEVVELMGVHWAISPK